ncbi:MAG: hypothetical protein L6U99_06505 [Clostridium sp.]|nr:MAG: hypothetical protein L6U99_06505 [Clostridium sp.]
MYDDLEYELENAFVGQSQNTNLVTFNMYSQDPQASFFWYVDYIQMK